MSLYPWKSPLEMEEVKKVRDDAIMGVVTAIRLQAETLGFCNFRQVENIYQLDFGRARVWMRLEYGFDYDVSIEAWVEWLGGENYGLVSQQLSALLGIESARRADGTAYWEVVKD